MSLLPDIDRVLLGPGPSLTAPRVMRAMASPTLSHLDPLFMNLLDDVRLRLLRVLRAAGHSFALAVSGTGTSGMETVVANLVREGTRATVVVSGYFGDRLAQMCERYGATVARLQVEWGRACAPDALRMQRQTTGADVVAMVHAETSTGVCNSVRELAAVAREHGALTIVDAVTSLGGMPLDVGAWDIDACYSCTQKCLGGPSGLAPVVFGPRALGKRVKCRSFYFDLGLLEDYWLRRKYHHTMSSALVYALYEALSIVEEEGLDARWARHERNHRTLVAALSELGLTSRDVDCLAVGGADGGTVPVITFRAKSDEDPPWALGAVRLLAAAALGTVLLGLIVFEWSQASVAGQIETALVEARRGAQSGRDGIDPAARLFAMKAEVGVLGVWDELSRILPDHTFLTETRLADGKVTLSGFSADAARLVRIIDQSPMFSGATLAAAITPDANERKDRFSITFKLRGARAVRSPGSPRGSS